MTEKKIKKRAKCGTTTGYKEGCRCELCSSARNEYRRSLREQVSPSNPISKLSITPLMNLFPEETSATVIAEILGVNVRTVRGWKGKNGHKVRIDKFAADSYAVKLGKHPFEIWKSDWFRLTSRV